ncbi:hypothetical protein GN244_ATG12223 [Phytophthora infestans]|uniref:Uncharacterized protein n=1 Tax=Phytophthora infestans TaxID=4787 RepID=A0A833VZQ7_PHYIN|nr:hypothetical protein GN244_ATG12223 [Phytophthora infestans]KAF4146462.1 hypothetical protein GN958_ATG04327 [Phytophthora infestans]
MATTLATATDLITDTIPTTTRRKVKLNLTMVMRYYPDSYLSYGHIYPSYDHGYGYPKYGYGYPDYFGYESATSNVGVDDGQKEYATLFSDTASTKSIENDNTTESKALSDATESRMTSKTRN